MTDFETMKAMLVRAGIKFRETVLDRNGEAILEVEDGYLGFYSRMTFRPDGLLKSVEAFE